MTQSSKHRIPFKARRWGSSAHLARFSSRQGSRFIYTYDSMGRMLTRDDGTDLTTFTWDNWDCIKEVTGESETTYLVPQGGILGFTRNGVTYSVSTDALGSVRMITDEEGEVVARYEYSGFGAAISVTEDPVLAEFPGRFVGSLGVRFDTITGLHYMRARWHDSGLGRFISRDPLYCGPQGSDLSIGSQGLSMIADLGQAPNSKSPSERWDGGLVVSSMGIFTVTVRIPRRLLLTLRDLSDK